MRIFVTGATGFIGGRLALRLKQQGHEVIALARSSGNVQALKDAGVQIAPGDITQPDTLREPMRNADRVYHVAAWYEIGAADAARMRTINVDGTRHVMAEALRQGVSNVVYCSTVAVLGPNRNGPGDESQKNDGAPRSHYETTKREAHDEVLRFAEKGLPVRIAMPSAVYGPGDSSLIGWTMRLMVKGLIRVSAFPDACLTFTHVDDTAHGLELVAEKGRPGQEYIIAGQVLTLKEWMELMARSIGISPPRIWLKGGTLRALAPSLSPLARLAGLPPRIAVEGMAMADSWGFTSEKARRELGWNPRPAEIGMKETLEWFVSKYAPSRHSGNGKLSVIVAPGPGSLKENPATPTQAEVGQPPMSEHQGRPLPPSDRAILAALASATIPAGKRFQAAGEATIARVEWFLTDAGRWVRFGYRVGLRLVQLVSLLATGRLFTQLTAARQAALLNRWGSSGMILRVLALGLTTPIKIAHFDDPEIFKAYGSVWGAQPVHDPPPRHMAQVHEGEAIPEGEVLDCDVVVVGTGAGGAVAAKELAEKGFAVIMLEEGRYFTRKDFSRRAWDMTSLLYRDKGATFAIGNAVIPIPMGKTVGGSTTINTGTCWRTPPWVLEHWVKDLGLADLCMNRMIPHFERVEQAIGAEPADMKYVGQVGNIIARGCDALGYSHLPLKRNAPECDGAGVCNFGCPTDARRSMNISYVPMALQSGAVLYTGVSARRVWMQGDEAAGIEGEVLSTGRPFRVKARATVLACGTLLTPVLLLRQRLANRSGWVGRNLSIHPAVHVAALMDELVDGHRAIPQGYCVNQFHREGILLLGASPPVDFGAAMFPAFGQRFTDLMDSFDRIASFGAMIEDDTPGRVRVGLNGRPLILYSLSATELARFRRAVEILGEIFFAAGAREVHPMIHGFHEVRSIDELRRIRGASLKPRDFFLSAYHPLGTCRMGRDPASSVVSATHETHDVRRLYICDGSVVPSAVAVNPQETIMALSTRASEHIARSLS
ncbi:MAG: GMC family oxidoreductase N-terminal domain-containing protein [Nitrospirae bacterium]|nr:GMC family oxidoreductase N-terminal domain-containing protein [Nitrospirota bacterium]